MPRSRSASPQGSSDSFHLAVACEETSSAHRCKLSSHQRVVASNSSIITGPTLPYKKKSKDKEKDKEKEVEGDDNSKENKQRSPDRQEKCGEEIKGGKPCFEDEEDASKKECKPEPKKDPCASQPSDKKKDCYKPIPVCLPPLMCDVNDRPTVHQRRAEQAEVRAKLARETEMESQERERGGYNTGRASQKGGYQCPPGTYGPLAVPVPGCPDSATANDCSSMGSGRTQRPPSGYQGAGGPGACGSGGPGAYGSGGQAAYGSGAQAACGPGGPGGYGTGGPAACGPGGPGGYGSGGQAACGPGGPGGYGSGGQAAYGPGGPAVCGPGGPGGYGSGGQAAYGSGAQAACGPGGPGGYGTGGPAACGPGGPGGYGTGGPAVCGPGGPGGYGSGGQAACGPGGPGGYGSGGQAAYGPGGPAVCGPGGPGGYGPGGPGGSGAYAQGGPGAYGPRGNCPPGSGGQAGAQMAPRPPTESCGPGAYGPRASQPGQARSQYATQSGNQPGYQTGGRPADPCLGMPGSQSGGRNQPSPFGPIQQESAYPRQASSRSGASSGGGMGPQDDQSMEVNCVCTVTQSDAEPPGGNQYGESPRGFPPGGMPPGVCPPGGPPPGGIPPRGVPPGVCPPGGYPDNQFGGPTGYSQGNMYSGGAPGAPNDGTDAGCVYPQPIQQGGPLGGAPYGSPGGQSGKPSLMRQTSQKGQPRSQGSKPAAPQGQQNDQGTTQIILQIDAGRMLLGPQSGPICIPCTLMPVGQYDGGADDESAPTSTALDSESSAPSRQQQTPRKSGELQAAAGQPAQEDSRRKSSVDQRAFRPAPKGETNGQKNGEQPAQQPGEADFGGQTVQQNRPPAPYGSPDVRFDAQAQQGMGSSPAPPQGGYPQEMGPGLQGRNAGQGGYTQAAEGAYCPPRTAQGMMGPGQQGQSGFQLGPGVFQGRCNVPQDQGFQQGPNFGQRGAPTNGFCPPGGMEAAGQGYQQGMDQQGRGPCPLPRQSFGPGNDMARLCQGGPQQKAFQGQQRGQDMDCRAGNVSFQNGAQGQMACPPVSGQNMAGPPVSGQNMACPPVSGQNMACPPVSGQNMACPPVSGQNMACPPVSGQNALGGPGFAGANYGGSPQNQNNSQNDPQQAAALAMCLQRCCNTAGASAGKYGHDDGVRGRHRAVSSVGAADFGAEGNEARHGRQRRSNGHPKASPSRTEDDLSENSSSAQSALSKSGKEKSKGKEPKKPGAEMPTSCTFPMCVAPCCVIPCQTQCCQHGCCWSQPQCCQRPPTCMSCMPQCTPLALSNGQRGTSNVQSKSFGKPLGSANSTDDTATSYGGCRPWYMRYGVSTHRKACHHTIGKHSNQPPTSQQPEGSPTTT